jgi:hypothetical protein
MMRRRYTAETTKEHMASSSNPLKFWPDKEELNATLVDAPATLESTISLNPKNGCYLQG